MSIWVIDTDTYQVKSGVDRMTRYSILFLLNSVQEDIWAGNMVGLDTRHRQTIPVKQMHTALALVQLCASACTIYAVFFFSFELFKL